MGKTIRDPQGNVMIRLHQLPSGLWAIDLECPEALALAKYFLPAVPLEVQDRPGKPKSRWIYKFKPA